MALLIPGPLTNPKLLKLLLGRPEIYFSELVNKLQKNYISNNYTNMLSVIITVDSRYLEIEGTL